MGRVGGIPTVLRCLGFSHLAGSALKGVVESVHEVSKGIKLIKTHRTVD